MFGRDRELSELHEIVDAVRAQGASLLVRGEPGIGKTALLTVASRHAEATGMRVLRTTGVQSEARMPFAGHINSCSRCSGRSICCPLRKEMRSWPPSV